MPGGRREERDDVFVLEPGQGVAHHAGEPSQVGERVAQRMRALHVGVAVRGDHEQSRRLGGARDVPEQQQRRLGRPLEIVEHEEQGPLGRCRRQPRRDRLEQPVLLGLGVGRQRRRQIGHPVTEMRHQAHQLTGMTAEAARERVVVGVVDEERQRLDERLVRDADLVVAAAVQHQRTVAVRTPRDLAREPCLPDAGLAGEEHE